MYLYVLECPITSRLKVGRATNVVQRVRSIQTSCPVPLRVRLTCRIPDRSIEKMVHTELDEHRVRHTPGGVLTEWFEPAAMPKLAELVRSGRLTRWG
jgi:hypothetical protein